MKTETTEAIPAAAKQTEGTALRRAHFPEDAPARRPGTGEGTIPAGPRLPQRTPLNRPRRSRSSATQGSRQIVNWQQPATGTTQPCKDTRSLLHCDDQPPSVELSGHNAPPSANPVDLSEAGLNAADPLGMKQRILIVDDEPLARERLRRFLLKQPSVEIVGECCDGIEALASIKAERPDIVFLDLQMSGCDGLEVVARLDPTVRPAIIFVTAHLRYEVEATAAGSVDYILKPFGQERLQLSLEKARAYLRAKRADETGD